MKNNIIIVAISILFCSCVNEPAKPENGDTDFGKNGAMILCEGLQSTDQAGVTRIDFQTGGYSINYFSEANNGQKLGDVGNDMAIYDSVVYVALATTGTIEAFSLHTGKSIGRVFLPPNFMPRKMIFISDTLAYVTAYIELSIDDFYVYEFNPKKLELTGVKIKVGSHPEGITYYNNQLFVTNSGYGDFDANNPTASTISIIDLSIKIETKNIKTGNNPNRILSNGKGEIYVAYWELPENQDKTTGGIIEYDARTMAKLREWKTMIYDFYLSKSGDTLFYLCSSLGSNPENEAGGVSYLALNDEDATCKKLIINTQKNEIWTSLALNYERNEIWIANSFRYGRNGEIMIYDLNNPQSMKNKYETGRIPNTIRFY